jgi:AP-3 complex subunit beta
MNENSANVAVNDETRTPKAICTCILTAGNLLQVSSSDENVFKFSAKTLASGTLVLVSVKLTEKKARVTVNSEKMVIGTMLLKDIQKAMDQK